MRNLIEYILSKLFPVKNHVIETPEEIKAWFQYEVDNHPDIDPYRPFGLRDSWAGRVKEHRRQYEFPRHSLYDCICSNHYNHNDMCRYYNSKTSTVDSRFETSNANS